MKARRRQCCAQDQACGVMILRVQSSGGRQAFGVVFGPVLGLFLVGFLLLY